MTNCSITLKIDKLPKVINKVEYFMFQAMKQKNIDVFQVAEKNSAVLAELFSTSRTLIEDQIKKYIKTAEGKKKKGDVEGAEEYSTYAENLQNIIANWESAISNILVYSTIFGTKTTFKLDDDGMVDLSQLADDEEAIYKKFIVDQAANEIDPFDTIDKAVELFIRSIPRSEIVADEYGFNSSVDYSSFVRNLMADLENTTTIEEIISRLRAKLDVTPEYQTIIDMLEFKPTDNSKDIQLKINFRNSFSKAEIPIYTTSIEGNVIKVFEATVARRSKYEQIIKSNFALRGMPVTVDGVESNLAHQEDGVWVVDETDVPKIKAFLDRSKIAGAELGERRLQFLEALGFSFSPKTKEVLSKTLVTKKSFDYIYNHFLARLTQPSVSKNYGILGKTDVITDPISALKRDWNKFGTGQNNVINDIIELEVKYNPAYNIERSVINPEGNRQHSTQLNNNFTVVNKYLSDWISYPTLQSILESEPSMQWLNPETNPGIKDSMLLNSIFYLDPSGENYGMRKRVYIDKYGKYNFSPTQGVYVTVDIINTGGMQLKENGDKSEGASTTGLNEGDKLLQDLNTFLKSGFFSITRLSDKSTDLGIMLNFYADPSTGLPYKRPLGSLSKQEYNNVFSSEPFVAGVLNSLKDILAMKYLAKKGFYNDLDFASKNAVSTWFELDKVLSQDTKDLLDAILTGVDSIDAARELASDQDVISVVQGEVREFFEKYAAEYLKKMAPVRNMVDTNYLIGSGNFNDSVKYFLATAFLMDLENLKVFFGGSIHFKDFHKRASKDSATGIFTFMEPGLVDALNDRENAQGYGINTNLAARLLIDRLFEQGKITKEQRDEAYLKQEVGKEFRSALLAEVKFESGQPAVIKNNIEELYAQGYMSEESYELFKKNISQVISDKYNGDEADGQGKCTFDFYRIMSILTNNWTQEQETLYKKIVEHAHYDDLAETTQDETKRAEYIAKRDAVGYNPLEEVYFPPKKFQYAGPMQHEKMIDGEVYNSLVPAFDKFSLQPLIPTIIKGTEDEDLAKRMSFNGISYVKFKSASKAETTKAQDALYENYNAKNPTERSIIPFEQRVLDGTEKFKSEHILYMNHLKEQVRIDAEVHDETIFGSQARKLILMNLLSLNTTHNKVEFERLYKTYKGLINDLVQIEKTIVYGKLGIRENRNGSLELQNIKRLAEYFRDEVAKKNQDVNVRRVLQLDETGNFKIPLDAAVQAQIVEGILMSSINNNIVRYKASGSMLTQVAITGSGKKFSKKSSEKALETFGNKELKYYDVVKKGNNLIVTAMQVKIGLTKQWKPLLQLQHTDGSAIGSLERLNECLKNETWRENHRDSIRMISYRIPTQGRNFLDVMEVAEFLPAQFGDAIIMPTEAIVKSGSDFDIDKMFVFYPNFRWNGEYMSADYTQNDLKMPDAQMFKGSVQNKLYRTMAEIILHPNNYMELVTPSTNYHIEPIVDALYQKLGLKEKGKARPKTDYKHTDILNRNRNIEKFLSLLNGKNDLGIAALANTFNVLYQLSDAKSDGAFLKKNNIRSYFSNSYITKDGTQVNDIFYGSIYDEDGVLKSEFFSEFINAFVDVAKDDYVFGINVVTEFSPIIFYMKFAGLSSKKILAFINQPILRAYTKNLAKYENMFVKNYLDTLSSDVERQLFQYSDEERMTNPEAIKLLEDRRKLMAGARKKALSETLKQFGFTQVKPVKADIAKALGTTEFTFTSQELYNNIRTVDFNVEKLSASEKIYQLAVMFEMLNLKEQSDSMTNSQRFLNFDTKPYVSSFDVYNRETAYSDAVSGKRPNILSPDTLKAIKTNSVISPLDVAKELSLLLETLLPVRNNREFNQKIMNKIIAMRAEGLLFNEEDALRYARTAKNDFMNYVLQNFFDMSAEGTARFKQEFDTDKSLNEYLKNLAETDVLRKQLADLRNMDFYKDLVETHPVLDNIVIYPGQNTNLVSYKFIENSSNPVDKNSVISQLEDLASLQSPELQPVVKFIKNLSLYSVFQSGYNTSDMSYTGVVPIEIINPLYAVAIKEFKKLSSTVQLEQYDEFFKQFSKNNPGFFRGRKGSDTITGEAAKRGKWYSKNTDLSLKKKGLKPKQEVEKKKTTENSKELSLSSNNVDLIKANKKKTTSRNNKIRNGVYKTSNKEGNSIFVEATLYKKISVLDLDTQAKKEGYAKAEGFTSWENLEEMIYKGYTHTLKRAFLEGNQTVYVYTLKYLPEGKKAEESVQTSEAVSDNTHKINTFREELAWSLDMTNQELEEMYNKEKLSGEMIEEFLKRMSCLGKLK